MIKILHVVGIMDSGGIENFIMNIYRNIDTTKFQFDFLVHTNKEGIFDSEILKRGGKIHKISHIKKVGPIAYEKRLYEILCENNYYNVVHSHYNEISGLILKQAKRCNIKIRIAHSHSSWPKQGIFEKLLKQYCRLFIENSATHKLACGQRAGEWLYRNNKFEIINNGIEVEKFKFNEILRVKIREELGITNDEKLIGHIGRFHQSKNHLYLLEVFKRYHMKNNKSKLILLGDGILKNTIEKKILELNLENNVYLLGVVKNVNEYLSAMDNIIFPSINEGFPVTVIEAQINGLPLELSSNIAKEVDLGFNLIHFLSLNSDYKNWVDKVDSSIRRDINYDLVSKFDIKNVIRNLEEIYTS